MKDFTDFEIMEANAPGCKTCKSPGLNKEQRWLLVLAIYILISSIYGSIQIVKDIANFFTTVS